MTTAGPSFRIIAASAILASGMVATAPAPAGTWAPFRSEEYGFSAEFPGQPQIKAGTDHLGRPTADITVDAGAHRFWVACSKSEVLKHRSNPMATAAYLVTFCLDQVKKTGASELSSAEKNLGEFPGREVVYRLKDKRFQHWVVIGREWLYQVV
jgi:hypothetical protein